MSDQIKIARVTGNTLGSELPARISELESAISAITGIPLDTLINNPMFNVIAAGLRKAIFQDLAAEPTAGGEVARFGGAMFFHDGVAARRLWDTSTLVQRVKTANQVVGGVILVDATELLVPLPANQNAEFEATLIYIGDQVGNIKIGFTTPAGAVLAWSSLGVRTSVGTSLFDPLRGHAPDSSVFGCDGVTTRLAWIKGVVSTVGNAGNLQMQVAQNVVSGTSTLGAGSMLKRTLTIG